MDTVGMILLILLSGGEFYVLVVYVSLQAGTETIWNPVLVELQHSLSANSPADHHKTISNR